jgi:hypothetical protein
MVALSELLIVVLVILFLASLVGGTVFLMRFRGKMPASAATGPGQPISFRVPDWQYAVLCGTGVLFVIGISVRSTQFLAARSRSS